MQTNIIYDIHFGSNDLLYIGTDNGFWSYDGIQFKQYKTKNPQQSPTDVSNIQEDKQHNIYIQNFKGQIFYVQNDTLVIDSVAASIPHKIKNYLIKGVSIYYISDTRIHAYNKQKQLLKVLSNPDSTLNFWSISTGDGIVRAKDNSYDPQFKIYQLDKDTLISIPTPSSLKIGIRLMSFESKWAFTVKNNGYYSIKNDADSLLVDLSTNNIYLTPYKIKKIANELLVACKEGLYIPNTNQVYLKRFFITEVLLDQEHNLWCSTLEGGLFKLNRKSYHYPVNDEIKKIDYIFVHKNKIIVSDEKGSLYSGSAPKYKFESFFTNKKKSQVKSILYNPYGNSYLVASNDNYIFDTSLNLTNTIDGFGALDIQKNRIIKVRGSHSIMYSKASDFINVALNNASYERISDKIKILLLGGSKRTCFLHSSLNVTGINMWNNTIFAVVNDSLTYIDITNDKYTWRSICPLPNVIKSYVKNDRLFILTNNFFEEFDAEGKKIGRIDRKNGLENSITNFSIDDKHIAISTKQGIHLLDAHTFEYIYKFTNQNGITSSDFTKGWLYDGYLYVNGSKGVSKIVLDGNYNKGKPTLNIQSVYVNDSLHTNTQFAHDQNNIKVNFAVRSYTANGKLFWKINNNNWSILNEGTSIQLNELQANAYIIETYFENDLGIKTPTVKYTFTIHPPYWQTWWFYMLINLVGIGILGLLWKQRLASKHKEIKQKNQVNLLRMQALQTQMNPHFIFNVQAAIQGLWLEDKDEAALELQGNFSKLLREIFQYSGEPSISIDQLIGFLENYISLEKIRFEDDVDVDIQIDKSLFEEDYFILPLLIQPIIENSFKHGLLQKQNNRKLYLELVNKTPYLYCVIIDNGVGRSSNTQNNSQRASGLKTTQERLRILQESVIQKIHSHDNIKITDLKDNNQQSLGTKVELWIPFVDFKKHTP
ncbi:MAG: histidine kinase [Aureispira sp.]|nr:histidine kinase [Aureispira sp.]